MVDPAVVAGTTTSWVLTLLLGKPLVTFLHAA
jgi:hypothetical protein